MILTEFDRSVLIGIGAGMGSGIFSVILDYISAKFIQKDPKLNLTYFAIKAVFLAFIFAILLGFMAFIEVNFSTDLLSVSQINKSTIIIATILPLVNFAVDRFFGFVSAKKTE